MAGVEWDLTPHRAGDQAGSGLAPMRTYLFIVLGGGLGSVLRYWLSTFVDGRLGGAFPWGTLVVNVTGSFVIGFIATAKHDNHYKKKTNSQNQ